MRRAGFVSRFGFALIAAIGFALAAAAPASAQVCPYNSTQATCACPTAGGGTTCFGGQLYRASDSSCQNDTRSCASNQEFDCATASCACNTASFPCGGCTAATSSVGAACASPSGGKYTNVCGACSCPAGTTLCSSSNACVTNLSCPAGTTFDPCTNTCGTPYVLLSPAATQSGYIQVNGNIKTTAGDFYMPSGKSIHVDAAGATSLNVGNYGGGAFTMNVIGALGGNQLCVSGACRSTWPTTADFDPTYVNAGGDTMTGTLNLSGASSNLYVGGSLGVGTTTPSQKLDVVGNINASGGITAGGAMRMAGFTLTSGAAAGRYLVSDASGNGTWQTLVAPVNSVSGSGAGISVSPTTGNVVVSNTGVTSLAAGVDTYVTGATGAVTVGNNSTLQTVTGRGATASSGIGVGGAGAYAGYGLDSYGSTYGVYATGGNTGVSGNGGYTGVSGTGNTGVQGTSYVANGIGASFSASGSGGMGMYASGSSWGVYSAGGSNYFNGRVGIADQYPAYPLDIQGPGNAAIRLAGSYIGDNWDGTLHIQSGGGAVAFDGYDTVYISGGSALNLGGVSRTSWPSLSVINTSTTLYTWQGAGWKSVGCPGGYSLTGWSGYNCMSHGGEWECSSSFMHPTYVDVYYTAEASAYISINCAAVL